PTVLAIGEVRLPDPKSYKQAMQRPDAALWQEAVDTELANMRRNEVWSPIPFDQALSRGMPVPR
ncbi:hypothetical protein, partial [Burkholderia cenocepacia]|uniref:hypothetical protein n=1 Tax=Burkholderia cenocepacia TaxID=95486 RepID=UPI0022370A7A